MNKDVEDLLRKAKRLERQLSDAKETYVGVQNHFFSPVLKFISPVFRFLFTNYSRIWRRCAYRTDKVTGQRVISKPRSSVAILATILFIFALTPTQLGSIVRFFTVEPISDAALMMASYRTETFYLNNAEEIDPAIDLHSVRGCRIAGPCTEKDAVYFRVMYRLSHDIWKLFSYGNPFYVPDHVVAPIAPGVNRCEVTYYGYRMTASWIARLIRSMQVYPVMLETSCEHIGAA